MSKYKKPTRPIYEEYIREQGRVPEEVAECGGDGKSRFGGRNGNQVGSFFVESTVNERIKHIYGNYNLWSWLRYWFLDSANYTTLLLMDKGYYDYDYKPLEDIDKTDSVSPKLGVATMEQGMSDEDIERKLARFGLGKYAPKKPNLKELSAEELRDYVMKKE